MKELILLLTYLPFVDLAADDDVRRREGDIRGNKLELNIFYPYRFQELQIGLLDSLSDWGSSGTPVYSK